MRRLLGVRAELKISYSALGSVGSIPTAWIFVLPEHPDPHLQSMGSFQIQLKAGAISSSCMCICTGLAGNRGYVR